MYIVDTTNMEFDEQRHFAVVVVESQLAAVVAAVVKMVYMVHMAVVEMMVQKLSIVAEELEILSAHSHCMVMDVVVVHNMVD